jgi:hypothetical protein
MSFKYYMVDLEDGEVTGTNDPEVADAFAAQDTMVVINTAFNELLLGGANAATIQEMKLELGE